MEKGKQMKMTKENRDSEEDYGKLAGEFLLAVKMEEDCGRFIEALAAADPDALAKALAGDKDKNAFWINVYNAFNLHLMRSITGNTEDRKVRLAHFLKRQITIAGQRLNFVDIENGILRRSKSVIGLGYFGKLWVGVFERKMRVQQPDPRIHFALNCGAESCPPIRYYTAAGIDAELDQATRSYLSSAVVEENGTVTISALFNMYRGDFGGKRGALAFIRKYLPEMPSKPSKIRFSRWSWTKNLNSFAD